MDQWWGNYEGILETQGAKWPRSESVEGFQGVEHLPSNLRPKRRVEMSQANKWWGNPSVLVTAFGLFSSCHWDALLIFLLFPVSTISLPESLLSVFLMTVETPFVENLLWVSYYALGFYRQSSFNALTRGYGFTILIAQMGNWGKEKLAETITQSLHPACISLLVLP